DEVDIIVGTFSKSLASIGGFAAGSESVIHFLKHNSRPLIFTAALPPANTAGVLAALDILQREPERRECLWQNTRRLQTGLRSIGFDIGPTETPIVPVLIGPLEKTFLFWRKLFEAGVFTNPVVPPAVARYFLARANGRTVGRIAAIKNDAHTREHGDRVGFYGFFESIDDPRVARTLFDAAAGWLRERGLRVMRGPMSPSINDECGLL